MLYLVGGCCGLCRGGYHEHVVVRCFGNLNTLLEFRAQVQAQVEARLTARESEMLARWDEMAAQYARQQREFEQKNREQEEVGSYKLGVVSPTGFEPVLRP